MASELQCVMLIDDEEIDQLTYQRVLKRSGLVHDVLTFTYADEALDFLQANPEQKVDAIFLDINMPRMSGFEFLEAVPAKLGNTLAETCIVLLSTSVNPSDRARAADNPLVHDFLSKPLSVESIAHVAEMATQLRAEKV